ncbi:MbeD/MobD family mobilization/exclusion protein [Solidesulfovibrio sp. C21]|uniref:MbeD/MobD family mobilization/exclusion protein n=1 Tax=Solidesulfovibrio sp. C21 TaxID=3398613 RepID=UPI0039FB9559
MSMTELERHLLDGLEKIQQEFRLSQKNQDKYLADLKARQKRQEENLNQLTESFEELEPLLHRLNSALQHK